MQFGIWAIIVVLIIVILVTILNVLIFKKNQHHLENLETRLMTVQEKNIVSDELVYSLLFEYDIIWLINTDDLSMKFVESNGKGIIPEAVTAALNLNNYEKIRREYIKRYIVDEDKDYVDSKSKMEVVLENCKKYGIYRVNFRRIDEKGQINFHQLVYAKSASKQSSNYILQGFRNIDDIMKLELEKVEIEQRLIQYEQDRKMMSLIHDSLGSAPWEIHFNEKGDVIHSSFSDSFKEKLGYTPDEFDDNLMSWVNLIDKEDQKKVYEAFYDSVNDYSGNLGFDITYRMLTKNNGYRWFRSAGRCSRRGNGTPEMMMGLFMDIDDSVHRDMELQEQFEIFNSISSEYFYIFLIDIDTGLVKPLRMDKEPPFTKHTEKENIFDYAGVFDYISNRVYKDDVPKFMELASFDSIRKLTKENSELVYNYRVLENDGMHNFSVKYSKLPENGTGYRIIVAFKNIDDVVKNAEEKKYLRVLSQTDLMTGLLNRGSGEQFTREAVLNKTRGMFCIIDIDKFKSINDTYGHVAGDKVIVGVADCIKKAFRDTDVLFRLGGDEFAILAPNLKTENSSRKAMERFFGLLDKLKIEDFDDIKVCVSAGCVLIGKNEVDFENLYKSADTGVYLSKKTAGNALSFINI